MTETLPWGDMPYDSKTPAEVVDDYVLARGDLADPQARAQLAAWIERYADARAASADAECDEWERTAATFERIAIRAEDELDRAMERVRSLQRTRPCRHVEPPRPFRDQYPTWRDRLRWYKKALSRG